MRSTHSPELLVNLVNFFQHMDQFWKIYFSGRIIIILAVLEKKWKWINTLEDILYHHQTINFFSEELEEKEIHFLKIFPLRRKFDI